MLAMRYMVRDVDEAAKFYENLLEFKRKETWGPVVVTSREGLDLWLSGPGSSAVKTAVDGAAPTPGGSARLVITLKDLTGTLKSLEAAGVKVSSTVVNGPAGSWVVVADPSGNHVELFQPK